MNETFPESSCFYTNNKQELSPPTVKTVMLVPQLHPGRTCTGEVSWRRSGEAKMTAPSVVPLAGGICVWLARRVVDVDVHGVYLGAKFFLFLATSLEKKKS